MAPDQDLERLVDNIMVWEMARLGSRKPATGAFIAGVLFCVAAALSAVWAGTRSCPAARTWELRSSIEKPRASVPANATDNDGTSPAKEWTSRHALAISNSPALAPWGATVVLLIAGAMGLAYAAKIDAHQFQACLVKLSDLLTAEKLKDIIKQAKCEALKESRGAGHNELESQPSSGTPQEDAPSSQ